MKDKRVVFMGTPEFSLKVLESLIENTNVVLVVSQPDSYVGRHHELKYTPVKSLALEHNIEVFQPIKIKEDYQRILDVNPDIIVTCAYGQIIPKILLDTPKYKAINVHASLLPKLRGGSPLHKCLIDGYSETGITIMYMDVGMDSGDIIKQKSIKITDEDNVGTIHDKLSILGSELLIETLPSIFDGTNERIKQDESEVTFAYNIKREEERIDFNKTAREVFNQVRGLYPFPVGYTVINDEIVKICECKIGDKKSGLTSSISNLYNDGIGVMCSDKEIIITKLKPSGKKEMSARDYLNGKRNERLLGVKL